MSASFNTIVVMGLDRGRYDEDTVVTAFKPGHLVMRDSNNKLKPHATAGGWAERCWAIEDSLQGKDITAAYTVGDKARIWYPASGDKVQGRVPAAAVAIVKGDPVVSNGDGCLVKLSPTGDLYSNTAASSAINTTASDTAFDLTTSIPANSLKVGDVIRLRGQGIITSVTSTPTIIIKVKIGATTVFTSATIAVVANDVFVFDLTVQIRTIGASGTCVMGGSYGIGTPGEATTVVEKSSPTFLGSTAIDTTVANTVLTSATWSASSASNSLRQDQFIVSKSNAQGQHVLGVADEARDNSAGVAEDFLTIRVIV